MMTGAKPARPRRRPAARHGPAFPPRDAGRALARNIVAPQASKEPMKTTLNLAVLILCLATPVTSLALISVANVSRERAKELGIELRVKPNGPTEAWIELEFKPEGPFKEFQHVSLEIRDGDQFLLGWTPLEAKR